MLPDNLLESKEIVEIEKLDEFENFSDSIYFWSFLDSLNRFSWLGSIYFFSSLSSLLQ